MINYENVRRVADELKRLCTVNLERGNLIEAAWCDNGAQLLSRLVIND